MHRILGLLSRQDQGQESCKPCKANLILCDDSIADRQPFCMGPLLSQHRQKPLSFRGEEVGFRGTDRVIIGDVLRSAHSLG